MRLVGGLVVLCGVGDVAVGSGRVHCCGCVRWNFVDWLCDWAV